MGQMLALLTGGFDLSVGKIVAITSVITALTMAPLARRLSRCNRDHPDVGHAGRHRRRHLRRRRQRCRRRGVQRLAFHDDAGHRVDQLRHRLDLDQRRPGLWPARRLRHDLQLLAHPRHSLAGLRDRRAVRRHVHPAQLDPHGTLLLRGRRQPQGLAAFRHQHPVLPVHGLCAVRRAGRGRGHSADRAARNRRSKYRRLDAARTRSRPASSAE